MQWEIVHKVKENMRPWCTCPKCGEFIFPLSERKDYKYCPILWATSRKKGELNMFENVKPVYDWIEEDGVMICTLREGKQEWVGIANCHPFDKEYKSEYAGGMIAESRALINMYNDKLYNDALPRFKALKHLRNSMEQSYRYNPDSFEAKVMRKEYYGAQTDVEILRTLIRATKRQLANYISDREKYMKEKVKED